MKFNPSVLPRKFLLALCSLTLLAVLCSVLDAQTYVFNALGLPVGNNPQAVLTADLNADGRLDLVVANFNDSTVSVYLGKPDGSYQPRVDYPTGANPIALAAADFTGDHILDLAVVNNNCSTTPCAAVGSVSTLIGNGDGTLQGHLDTNVGNSPNALAFADLDGDGKLDIVVTNGQDNTFTTLIGRGNGTFKLKPVRTTGPAPHGIAIGQFSSDSFLDVVVCNSGDLNVGLYRGKGNGLFVNPLLFVTGNHPTAVATADFNNDGKMDIVTADAGLPAVSVLFGKGPNGFQPHLDLPIAAVPNNVAVGDFNGDGKMDIVASALSTAAVSVVMNAGNGAFSPSQEFASGLSPMAVATGDLTGDGKTDLAIANSFDNSVSILPGLGNGAFQARFEFLVGNMPGSVAVGDFNGDTFIDMAVANRNDNSVLLLLGDGNGNFTPAPGAPLATGAKPSAVITVDLNGDSILDLVTTNAVDNTISVFLGTGGAAFQAPKTFAVGKKPGSLVAGDFDNNGKLDLVVTNQNDSTVSILAGNGDGTFRPQHAIAIGVSTAPTAIVAGNFNTDSNLDLAVAANGTGGVIVLLGNGNGTFGTAVSYPTGAGPNGIALGDFNKDGKADLAVVNTTASNVSILSGNGDGTFQAHIDYNTARTPLSIVTGDFNGDGNVDLAVGASSTTSNRVSVLLGNSDGTFQAHTDHGTRVLSLGSGEAVAVADFNGDLSPDLAAVDQISNVVSVFLNSPLPVAYPSVLNFGTVDPGVQSTPQDVTITNAGSALLSNLNVSASGDYAEGTACGPGLVVGANCTTSVTFTPTDGGTRTGSLSFSDNAPGGGQSVLLIGTGNAPAVTLLPSSLNFGVIVLGQGSVKQNLILTNIGVQPLTISSVVVSGDFLVTSQCGPTLAAGSSCTIGINFKPRQPGVRTGTLTVNDNAAGSPHTVALTGTGTMVKVAPTNLVFGDQAVGTTSPSQTVTLTNVGQTILNLSSVAITGNNGSDFSLQSTCGATVAKGASCTMTVTFTPSATGARSAAITLTDDGGGSPQNVPLSGTGI